MRTGRGSARRGAVRTAPATSVLLAALVAVAFAPSVGNGFVNWDDPGNFLENPYFRGLGWDQFRWAWVTTRLGVYQPLGWMLLEAEYAAWGLDARGYHLISVLLHVVNALILARLLEALLVRRRPSAAGSHAIPVAASLAAALFAVHPLRVEAVAWVSCQTYLPCATFAMLSTLAYLRAHPGDGPSRVGWQVAALLAFAASLLFKAPSAGLPVVLLILDVYPLRRTGPGGLFARPSWRLWAEKVPFFVLSSAALAAALAARVSHPESANDHGLADRIVMAGYAAVAYLAKTAWPAVLVAHYPLPGRGMWRDPSYAPGLLVVAVVSAGAVLSRHRRPGLLAAWLGYLALLAPTMNLVRVDPWLIADRYSYLASTSLAALLAGGLADLFGSPRRARARIAATLGLVAALLLTVLTWRQGRTWRDSESLWSHAIAQGVRSSVAHTNLGMAVRAKGHPAEAVAQYHEALRIWPDDPYAHNSLGALLQDEGRLDEARDHFLAAVRLRPGLAQAHNNLGINLGRRGRLDEAADAFAEAVRLQPEFADAHHNLGTALARQGRLDQAITHFSAALRLDPGHTAARQYLARAVAQRRASMGASASGVNPGPSL